MKNMFIGRSNKRMDIEFGKCDICGKETCLNRKYYYYDIKCECHSPQHFELVCYCDDCKDKVKPPTHTLVRIKPIEECKGVGE